MIESNSRYSDTNRYFQDVTIPCYGTDASFHLKPAFFMDLAQELAYWAAQRLEFGYDDLARHHTAWVLSRMHFRFLQPPRWRDETTLYTWHKGLDGLFFLRDFEMREKGDVDFADKSKALISCTTSWIVMDQETRRLARNEEVLDMVPASTQCPDDAISERCAKLVIPKEVDLAFVREHKIAYSDVDIIGHTNNARYMVWAMDCIDYETASRDLVKDVQINFNKETKAGEIVQLYSGVVANDHKKTYYMEGRTGGKSCFCAQIDY